MSSQRSSRFFRSCATNKHGAAVLRCCGAAVLRCCGAANEAPTAKPAGNRQLDLLTSGPWHKSSGLPNPTNQNPAVRKETEATTGAVAAVTSLRACKGFRDRVSLHVVFNPTLTSTLQTSNLHITTPLPIA